MITTNEKTIFKCDICIAISKYKYNILKIKELENIISEYLPIGKTVIRKINNKNISISFCEDHYYQHTNNYTMSQINSLLSVYFFYNILQLFHYFQYYNQNL